MEMNFNDISKLRLQNQCILSNTNSTVKDVVGYMGAVQAQDYGMSKLAVGIRNTRYSENEVEKALNKGEILRTHVLRPTWHLVSSDDIHWLLDLTGPRVKSLLKTRHKELVLTDSILDNLYALLKEFLAGGKHATKEELTVFFTKEKIATEDNRMYHILMSAELDGVICSGAINGKKQTYALLDERVQRKINLTRDEALEKLARRYFTSHAPATVHDFVWWSGLTLSDTRKALEMIKKDFDSVTIDKDTYWFPNNMSLNPENENHAFFLPAFDEILISYTNRTATISKENQSKAFTTNGIFRPILVLNGQVVAIWKRTVKKNKISIEIEPFKPFSKSEKELINNGLDLLRNFWEKDVEI